MKAFSSPNKKDRYFFKSTAAGLLVDRCSTSGFHRPCLWEPHGACPRFGGWQSRPRAGRWIQRRQQQRLGVTLHRPGFEARNVSDRRVSFCVVFAITYIKPFDPGPESSGTGEYFNSLLVYNDASYAPSFDRLP